MSQYEYKNDYVEDGLKKQIQFFKSEPNIESVVRVDSKLIQRSEDGFLDMRDNRNVFNAFGATLDGLGEYLKVARNSDTDDAYRARILTAVYILFNAGQHQVVKDAFKNLLNNNNVILDEIYPNTIILTVIQDDFNIANQGLILQSIKQVKQGGIELVAGVVKSTKPFKFAAQDGQTGNGFISSVSGGTGGTLGSLLNG